MQDAIVEIRVCPPIQSTYFSQKERAVLIMQHLNVVSDDGWK